MARRRGEGQAVQAVRVDAGVRGGVDGGGNSTMHSACASTDSGRPRVGKEGKVKRFLSDSTIGPDQTADAILPNPGKDNIQLMLAKFQRGNTSYSNL